MLTGCDAASSVESVSPNRPSKRDAILQAALELFVERGFHGTAVPLVAKRAGVSTGSIYNYFDSKELLVNALFRELKQDVAEQVYARLPVDAAPREQFRVVWQYMREYAAERPKALAFLELHHHGSYLDDESRAVEQQLDAFATSFVERAQQQGVLKELPPVLLMEMLYGAFLGIMRAHWEGRLELTEEVLTAAEQACWHALAKDPTVS